MKNYQVELTEPQLHNDDKDISFNLDLIGLRTYPVSFDIRFIDGKFVVDDCDEIFIYNLRPRYKTGQMRDITGNEFAESLVKIVDEKTIESIIELMSKLEFEKDLGIEFKNIIDSIK